MLEKDKLPRIEEIQNEALGKYDAIISFAEKQDPDLHFSRSYLFMSGFSLGVEACPYCMEFRASNIDMTPHFSCQNTGRGRCPLGGEWKPPHRQQYERGDCCEGLYLKMISSETWGEFVENAKLVRNYIRIHGGDYQPV